MAAVGLEAPAGGHAVDHVLSLDRDRWMFDEAGAVVEAPKGEVPGRNLIGMIPGTDLADEYVLIMAHYDHLGVASNGDVYNGAFDDATGVSALLEFARVLVDQEVAFRRTLVFLITDAEEVGLLGAQAWIENPTMALDKLAIAISVDPLGRPIVEGYAPLAILGAERCVGSREIWALVAEVTGVPVFLVNRAPLLVYGSDQDRFWAQPDPLPGVWIASPGMTWYHTTDDTPESIDYRSVKDHLAAIAQGTAAFADADETCTDRGPQELSREDMISALAGIEALEATGELTIEERSALRTLRNPIEDAANGGEVGVEARTAYLDLMLLLVTQIAPDHPGAIPPPFPEE